MCAHMMCVHSWENVYVHMNIFVKVSITVFMCASVFLCYAELEEKAIAPFVLFISPNLKHVANFCVELYIMSPVSV